MRSIKNLLARRPWHLVLLYADENGDPGALTITKCRTRLGVNWQLKCFTTALPERVGRSFVVTRVR
jgi:hypothetical protein